MVPRSNFEVDLFGFVSRPSKVKTYQVFTWLNPSTVNHSLGNYTKLHYFFMVVTNFKWHDHVLECSSRRLYIINVHSNNTCLQRQISSKGSFFRLIFQSHKKIHWISEPIVITMKDKLTMPILYKFIIICFFDKKFRHCSTFCYELISFSLYSCYVIESCIVIVYEIISRVFDKLNPYLWLCIRFFCFYRNSIPIRIANSIPIRITSRNVTH